MRDVETKDPINTMHQSLAEKEAEAPTDTLSGSLAQIKAQKVDDRLTNVKGASLATFSIRFFMGNSKPENRKMSRDQGLAVTFAVCSSRLNRRKGFQR